jgi:hypothetical protein
VKWRLLFLALAAAGVWFAWRSEFNHDEIEHLHAAWLMSVGQRPYADFLEQHHPTLWIFFRPLVAQFSSPRPLVFVARLYDLAVLAALLWTLQRLIRRLVPDAAPWAVLLLLGSYIFAHNMLLFRPDPTMNALFYGGLYQWARFLDERKPARAAAAGLLFGLAVAVLQKALVVCGLVGLSAVALSGWTRDRRSLLVGMLAALGAALLPLGALAAWVAAHGIWREFWFWNYDFNKFFYTRANLSMQFSVGPRFLRSLLEDPALWGFGAVGAWGWLRRAKTWDANDQLRLTLLVTLLAYMALLTFNRFPFEQYFIVFLPLLAPFAAEALTRTSPWLVRLACAAVLAVTLGQFVDLADSRPQRRVQDYLLAHTAPSQTIYASPPHHPIFRRDGSFFWYNAELIGQACAAYSHQVRAVECVDPPWPPSYVFLDPEFPSYWPWRWTERAAAFQPTGESDIFVRKY